MPAAHGFDVRHVLFRRVVGDDAGGRGRRLGWLGCGHRRGDARSSASVEYAFELEIPAVALDLLLLAIHKVDVVAEDTSADLYGPARQLFFNGLELEQQIVAERADEREARILGVPELVDQGAQNGKRRGLLAALFLGEQLRQRLQAAAERGALAAERIPMRMPLQTQARAYDSASRRAN